jgi:hypothetical protein
LANQCTSRTWFVKVGQVERMTFIYWPIKVLQKLNLSRCANLKELPSSIGKVNALQKFYL